MNTESQVTSLELSKQLKEFGVKQDSLFYWEWESDLCYGVKFIPHCTYPLNNISFTHFSAFTVSELLSLIPRSILVSATEPYNSFRFHMEKGIWCKKNKDSTKFTDYYRINYLCDTWDFQSGWPPINLLSHNINDENPANALALMLIYLYENGLINND